VTAREPCARVDPALGRLPGAVADALLRGDAWRSTVDLSITTALAAAAPNTRIAWAYDFRAVQEGHTVQDLVKQLVQACV
jgi:hypothetical protein